MAESVATPYVGIYATTVDPPKPAGWLSSSYRLIKYTFVGGLVGVVGSKVIGMSPEVGLAMGSVGGFLVFQEGT
jgi:hypothetical protein